MFHTSVICPLKGVKPPKMTKARDKKNCTTWFLLKTKPVMGENQGGQCKKMSPIVLNNLSIR